ncbi:arsenate reductase ArsC [Candidatus Nitrosopumilus sp. SW]|uniref:arsenate reductase/protein-tyrosine-phosphatase family protein n=1 Tax=Candidatus Nitrosopumilus sp. SW TaxID=2508726 RepID=UPI0021050503|nr:arsenate reductase ArsC [Candidatus Nitrosopumilus sp. SW]
MAEAFFRKYAPSKYDVISAGTAPSSQLNPIVVEVMKEIGIDMMQQSPKNLSNEMIETSLKTINMGCMDKESCPALFVNEVLDWNISDPKEKPIDDVREIRDQILKKVLQLIESLEK